MWINRTEAIWDFDFSINNGQHNVHCTQGVLFDSKLIFVKHIQTVVLGVKGALGFVKCTLKNKFTIESVEMLYYALVRSKLEFDSVVWQQFQICI